MSSPSVSSVPAGAAFPVGRAVLMAGGFVASLSGVTTWFWGGEPGEVRYETALQGEESLFAVLAAFAGLIAAAIASARKSASKALAFVGLAGGLACVVLAWIFIDYNSQPVVVYGKTIPTGIGTGADVGLGGGVVMVLGGIIDVVRALKR